MKRKKEQPSPRASTPTRHQMWDPISQSFIFVDDKVWNAAIEARRGITDWTEEDEKSDRWTYRKGNSNTESRPFDSLPCNETTEVQSGQDLVDDDLDRQ